MTPLVGVDVGTSATKVVAIDRHGRVVRKADRPYRTLQPPQPTSPLNPSPQPPVVASSPSTRALTKTAPAAMSHQTTKSHHPNKPDLDDQGPMRQQVQPDGELVLLVYELLDAHDDTARIATELARELPWAAHLEYLRALQRKGREIVAHTQTRAGAIGLLEPPTVPGP